MYNNVKLSAGDKIKLKFHAMSDLGRKNTKEFILPCVVTSDNRRTVNVPRKDGSELSYEVAEDFMKKSSDPSADYESEFMHGFCLIPDEFFNAL